MHALQRQMTKLSPSVLYRFISVAARLKDDILVVQPSHHLPEDPALVLPPAIVTLISRVCDIPQDEVEYHWDRLKDVIWCSTDLPMQESALEALFLKHGHDIGFCEFLGLHCSRNVNLNCSFEASSRTIYPPQHMCTNNSCIRTERGLRLSKAEPRQAVLYTLGEGPLPVWTVHLYCGGQEYYIFSCASLITPPRMSYKLPP
jgi:hypothetical protein